MKELKMVWGERLSLYSHIKKEMKLEGPIKNTESEKKSTWGLVGVRE